MNKREPEKNIEVYELEHAETMMLGMACQLIVDNPNTALTFDIDPRVINRLVHIFTTGGNITIINKLPSL